MKKILIITFLVAFLCAISLATFAQQGKGKNKPKIEAETKKDVDFLQIEFDNELKKTLKIQLENIEDVNKKDADHKKKADLEMAKSLKAQKNK